MKRKKKTSGAAVVTRAISSLMPLHWLTMQTRWAGSGKYVDTSQSTSLLLCAACHREIRQSALSCARKQHNNNKGISNNSVQGNSRNCVVVFFFLLSLALAALFPSLNLFSFSLPLFLSVSLVSVAVCYIYANR